MSQLGIQRLVFRPNAQTRKRMLLALDIGNSAVKGGLFRADELVHVFTVEPPSGSYADASPAHWHRALSQHLNATSIDQTGLVSVVPAATSAVKTALEDLHDAPILALGPEAELPFHLAYDTPETLGVDRMAAAAAGWVRHGQPSRRSVIVVDVGTAVNYEVVDRDGTYHGGAIGPGPTLARDALQQGTAQLPKVPLTVRESAVGRSTRDALQSGIVWGLIDSVRGMRARLSDALPGTPRLVLTGGWSSLVADRLDAVHAHDPDLVLRGVGILTRMNR